VPSRRWIAAALLIAAAVLGALLSALGAPGLARPDLPVLAPGEIAPAPPGRGHLLGTDPLGRDLLARLLAGASTSLGVALAAQALALLIGLSVGALAGAAGGSIDSVLMRGADLLLSLPAPLVLIAVLAALPDAGVPPLIGAADEPATLVCLLALGLLGWGEIARVVRASIIETRRRAFSEAARAAGAGPLRLLGMHLLPHAVGPVWTLASAGVGANVLAEAWLSFLGIGVRPPRPSWGGMIADGTPYLTSHPWLCIFPGLALTLTVLGFHLLGDWLRELHGEEQAAPLVGFVPPPRAIRGGTT
jgi:peptide/nickel transport system permease protein